MSASNALAVPGSLGVASAASAASTASGTSCAPIHAVVDEKLFQAYWALRMLENKYPELKQQLQLAKLCICGEQTAGKSSLLQYYMGFPCSYVVSGDTGTRCPVSYVLVQNDAHKQPNILEPRDCSVEELAGKIGQHMEALANANTFSVVPYQVKVECSHYMNLELVDLPGLVEGSDAYITVDGQQRSKQEFVKQIAAHYLSKPEYIIVFLRHAQDDLDKDVGYKALLPFFKARSKNNSSEWWLTIGTKFQDFDKTDDSANKLFAGLLHKYERVWFTEMYPPVIINGQLFNYGNATFQQRAEYIRNIPRNEQQLVANWINQVYGDLDAPHRSEKAAKFKKDYLPLIGIEKVTEAIKGTWTTMFKQQLTDIRSSLLKAVTKSEQTKEDWKAKTAEYEPEIIRAKYINYVEEFMRTMGNFLTPRSEVGIAPGPIYGSHYGVTYLDEVKQFDSASFTSAYWTQVSKTAREWVPFESEHKRVVEVAGKPLTADKKKSFSEQLFCQTLQSIAVGGAQIARLHKILIYLVLVYIPPEPEFDEVQHWLGHLPGMITTANNPVAAARQITRHRLQLCFKHAADWLAGRQYVLFNQFYDNVNFYLTKDAASDVRFPMLISHDVFLHKFRLVYLSLVQRHCAAAQQLFRQTLQHKIAYLNLDVTTRLVYTVANAQRCISYQYHSKPVKSPHMNGYTDGTVPNPGTMSQVMDYLLKPDEFDFVSLTSSPENISVQQEEVDSLVNRVKAICQEMYEVSVPLICVDLTQIFNLFAFDAIRSANTREPEISEFLHKLKTMPEVEVQQIAFSDKANMLAEYLKVVRDNDDKIGAIKNAIAAVEQL